MDEQTKAMIMALLGGGDREKLDRALQQELAIHDNLGPEGVKRQIDLGSMDQRGALMAHQNQGLENQLAQAQALMMKPGSPAGPSVAGNILRGVGDIGKNVAGMMQAKGLQNKMGELNAQQLGVFEKQDAARLEHANAQAEAIRRLQQQQAEAAALMKAQQEAQQAQQMGAMAGGGPRTPGFGMAQLQPNPYGY